MNKTDLQLYLADLMGWNGKKMLDGRVTIEDKFSNAVMASQVINGNVVGEVIASRIEMPDLTWDLLIPIALDLGATVNINAFDLDFYGYHGNQSYERSPEGLAEALIDDLSDRWKDDAYQTHTCPKCFFVKLTEGSCDC